jgi:hypothetical protein
VKARGRVGEAEVRADCAALWRWRSLEESLEVSGCVWCDSAVGSACGVTQPSGVNRLVGTFFITSYLLKLGIFREPGATKNKAYPLKIAYF